MLRLLHQPKTLIILSSQRTRKNTYLHELTNNYLSLLYKIRIENEVTIYSAITHEPSNKIMIVYINDASLQYSPFRDCILTCMAARLSVILLLDLELTTDQILCFFPYISQRRYEKLKSCLVDGLYVIDQNDTLNMINDKIKSFSELSRKASFTDVNKISLMPRSIGLQSCLQNKKLPLIKPFKKCKIFSYNVLENSSVKLQSKEKRPKSVRYAISTAERTNSKITELPLVDIDMNENITSSSSNIEILLNQFKGREIKFKEAGERKYEIETITIKELPSMSICPTIEISDEDKNMVEINEDSQNLLWRERRVPLNVVENYEVSKFNSSKKRHSLDYVKRKYLVYDPDEKKENKLFYIDYPGGSNNTQRRHSDSSAIESTSSTRRNSIVVTSLNNSYDDINLEFADDCCLESPIPSPLATKQRVYQNPLPIFPDEVCFPPLGLFPCDLLQKRRPSVFDVLLNS